MSANPPAANAPVSAERIASTAQRAAKHANVFQPTSGLRECGPGTYSFSELADAIDTAFARWDSAHLHQFVCGDREPHDHRTRVPVTSHHSSHRGRPQPPG